jgi:hypothetical protein
MLATDLPQALHDPTDWFEQESADIRIALLDVLARRLHEKTAQSQPGIFFSQVVQQLIRHVEQVPQPQKADVLKEMVSGANTRLAAAYGDLNRNMQLAFWYRLANTTRLMTNVLSSLEQAHQWSLETHLTLEAHSRSLAKREINELSQIFKAAVAMTGKPTVAHA